MELSDLIRQGAFYPALKDWAQYGDNHKMLAFILEHGVQTGYEADLLVALLKPIIITGKDRTTSKTREIMKHYKAITIRRNAEIIAGLDCISLESEREWIAKLHSIEPDSLKKIVQRKKKM